LGELPRVDKYEEESEKEKKPKRTEDFEKIRRRKKLNRPKRGRKREIQ
jgi:hypothetical protein